MQRTNVLPRIKQEVESGVATPYNATLHAKLKIIPHSPLNPLPREIPAPRNSSRPAISKVYLPAKSKVPRAGTPSNPLLSEILRGAESSAFYIVPRTFFLPRHREAMRAKLASLRPRLFTMRPIWLSSCLVGRCVKLARNTCRRWS